ncbi:MAG: hypothetical protein ACTTKZ_00090 [Bacteroides sp.]
MRVGKLVIYAFALTGLMLGGCQCTRTGPDVSDDFNIPDSLKDQQEVELSEGVTEKMVENISSPVETAALIKRLKVPFNKDLLISTDVADHFNTNFEKALGLGLYGTDLGYLNMYEKTTSVLNYISSVKDLADGIQVGQFFDFSTLKRLASNNENLDSLIFISQQSYNKIDRYLRSTNRAALSVVIVTGVWVEGMYLSTRVAQMTKNRRMEESVADQKVVLATLIPILRVYERDLDIRALADRLEKLRSLYDDVRITYEQGTPETRVVDGKLVVEQKDKQIVEYTPELIQELMSEIIAIRTELITPKG